MDATSSTTSTLKQRQVAHLASRLATLANNTSTLVALCDDASKQAADQRELALYHASFFMAANRVLVTPDDEAEDATATIPPATAS